MVTENDRWRRACNRDENEWMRNARGTISLAWWTPFIPRVGRVSHVEAGGCNSRVPPEDCNHFPFFEHTCNHFPSETTLVSILFHNEGGQLCTLA
jgi:hypothetical protein